MTDHPPHARHIVGAMTGSSIDGVDVVLAEVRGSGLGLRARFLRGHSAPLGELAASLRSIALQNPTSAHSFAHAARELGLLHARVIAELLDHPGAPLPDLIVAHGQTVYHAPPLTRQLLDPAPIARRLRCPVLFDLRAADLEMGGQGAPITPIADWVLLRSESEPRAVANLGGFCNITLLPAGDERHPLPWLDAVRGYDLCACNQPIDEAARAGLSLDFDPEGAAAMRGLAHPEATAELRQLLELQRQARRSLGAGDEAAAWAQTWRHRLSGPDLARSACRAVGAVIGSALRDTGARRALLAGGGVRNAALALEVRDAAHPLAVDLSDSLGVPAQYREALAMAVLGALTHDGLSITLPAVTGRLEGLCLAGCWASPLTSPFSPDFPRRR